MTSILISTQILENYGNRWKPKGGENYIVTGTMDSNVAIEIVEFFLINNELYQEYVISSEVVSDNHEDDYEIWQMSQYGKIDYPIKRFFVKPS